MIESGGIRDETGKLAAGAGVGSVVGGILGGMKGAVRGALLGAGGTLASTDGKDVKPPAGSILRARFDSPLTLE